MLLIWLLNPRIPSVLPAPRSSEGETAGISCSPMVLVFLRRARPADGFPTSTRQCVHTLKWVHAWRSDCSHPPGLSGEDLGSAGPGTAVTDESTSGPLGISAHPIPPPSPCKPGLAMGFRSEGRRPPWEWPGSPFWEGDLCVPGLAPCDREESGCRARGLAGVCVFQAFLLPIIRNAFYTATPVLHVPP